MIMRVRVLLVGPAPGLAGVAQAEVELDAGSTVGELREALAAKIAPLARGLPAMRIAVNASFVGDDIVLVVGDEVAVIPPVSGG